MKNKKIIIVILLTALILVLGVTFAYFQNSETFFGAYNSSNYKVELKEDFDSSWSGNKKVSISNSGDANVLIRISYSEIWSKNVNNKIINLNNFYQGKEIVKKNWNTTFLEDFVLVDGWYYYKNVLKKGEEISLLESITLLEESYRNYDYELNFNYESIAATTKAVNRVWGLNAEVKGESLIWK